MASSRNAGQLRYAQLRRLFRGVAILLREGEEEYRRTRVASSNLDSRQAKANIDIDIDTADLESNCRNHNNGLLIPPCCLPGIHSSSPSLALIRFLSTHRIRIKKNIYEYLCASIFVILNGMWHMV